MRKGGDRVASGERTRSDAGTRDEAGDGIRTHDNHVGNVVLYQLSYTRTQAKGRLAGTGPADSRSIESGAIIGAGMPAARSPGGSTAISGGAVGPIGAAEGGGTLVCESAAAARRQSPSTGRHLGGMPVDVRIVILTPSGKHRTITRGLPVLVGRGDEAALRVPQDCVSRRHCELREKGGAVVVHDLASTNGTLLDGVEIPQGVDVTVPCGATLRVGGATFRIEFGTPQSTIAESRPRDDDPGVFFKGLS